jgi:uncharacterized protein YacL
MRLQEQNVALNRLRTVFIGVQFSLAIGCATVLGWISFLWLTTDYFQPTYHPDLVQMVALAAGVFFLLAVMYFLALGIWASHARTGNSWRCAMTAAVVGSVGLVCSLLYTLSTSANVESLIVLVINSLYVALAVAYEKRDKQERIRQGAIPGSHHPIGHSLSK